MVYRNTIKGLVAGVCAGLANQYNVSAWALRLAFMILFLCFGLGLFIYLHLWNKSKVIDYQLDLKLD